MFEPSSYMSSKPLLDTMPVQRYGQPTIHFLRRRFGSMYHVPDDYVVLQRQFKWYLVVVAYTIATCGALVTLELLVRRTTTRGLRNIVLLLMAGFSFGAVSTFSMHFIFNNALSLHHPDEVAEGFPAIYLSYDWLYSILSLVASWAAMTLSFFFMAFEFSWANIKRWMKLHFLNRHPNVNATPEVADEYNNWKHARQPSSQSRSETRSIVRQSGKLMSWTLLDSGSPGDPSGTSRKTSKAGGRDEKMIEAEDKPEESGNQTSLDVLIAKDGTLAEIEFRLGKSGVEAELDRRGKERVHDPGSDASRDYPSFASNLSATDRSSSVGSRLPFLPPTAARRPPPIRHVSDTVTKYAASPSPIFSSPFASSSADIEEPPHSAPLLSPRRSYDSAVPFDTPTPAYNSRRRASLPVSAFSRNSRQNFLRSAGPLARIQSLPEPEYDIELLEKGMAGSPKATPPLSTSSSDSMTGDLDQGVIQEPQQVSSERHKAKKHSRTAQFFGLDVVTRTDLMKILACGFVAGWGVAGMHYIGQCSIVGMPYIGYMVEYVIGSVIIASGAVIIALYIMFVMLRPKLKHTWLSKLGVAFVLAAAVTMMHFCGTMGTVYAWPVDRRISSHRVLTGVNAGIVGIVIALACMTCLACIGFLVVDSYRLKRERERRRRVVVAIVGIDDHDRILVSSIDGLLPMCDIASLAPETGRSSKRKGKTSFSTWSNDSTVLGLDLSIGHEAFVQAVKLSWSWRNGTTFHWPTRIPSVSVTSQPERRGSSASTTASMSQSVSLSTTDSGQSRASVIKFVEKFSSAASDLAVKMTGRRDGISRVGVLYDQILSTGWVKLPDSTDTISKGQLVFLVRRITSSAERSDLVSRQFIFADANAVASALVKTLSVTLDDTLPLLEGIKTFAHSTMSVTVKPATLYTGVAIVQATPFDGLRIMLEEDNRSQLPMREIGQIVSTTSSASTTSSSSSDNNLIISRPEEIGGLLRRLSGMSLLSLIARNIRTKYPQDSKSSQLSQDSSSRLDKLLRLIERALIPMLDTLLSSDDMQHILPRLTLYPSLIPLTPGQSSRLPGYTPPYLIIFYAHYDPAINTFIDKWLPFNLFRAQNACVIGPRIEALRKAELAAGVWDHGGETIRRPSKVQFEFPDSSSNSSNIEDRDGIGQLVVKPHVSPIFGEYAFPSPIISDNGHPTLQSATEIIGSRITTKLRDAGSTDPLSVDEKIGPFGDDAHDTRNQSLSVPRRSSMVPTNKIHPTRWEMEMEMGRGVDDWDQDWLLNLLRTRLSEHA
ncbi:hypothetical protein M231_01356 [Tremella mesenterica]|uniref:MHYT domain-containing protein n=1 Tax=Tremella mesenterica TaxID=5217 RepID=A0A4Q1BTX1_TREME|nr:hypothetical protein M231_01356 [Tremella mesenterica]